MESRYANSRFVEGCRDVTGIWKVFIPSFKIDEGKLSKIQYRPATIQSFYPNEILISYLFNSRTTEDSTTRLIKKLKHQSYEKVSQLSLRKGFIFEHHHTIFDMCQSILLRSQGRRYQYLSLDPEQAINSEEQKDLAIEKLLKFSELMLEEFDQENLDKSEYKKSGFMGLLPFEVKNNHYVIVSYDP